MYQYKNSNNKSPDTVYTQITHYKKTHSGTNYPLYLFLYLSHDRWISDEGEHNLETSFCETTSAIPEAIDDVCSGRWSRLIQVSSEWEAQAKRKWNKKMLEFVTPNLLTLLYVNLSSGARFKPNNTTNARHTPPEAVFGRRAQDFK